MNLRRKQRLDWVVGGILIALLRPVVLLLGWMMRRHHERTGQAKVSAVRWFLVLFVAFAAIQSTGVIRKPVVEWLRRADLWLLCLGMAGVGLQTASSPDAHAQIRS